LQTQFGEPGPVRRFGFFEGSATAGPLFFASGGGEAAIRDRLEELSPFVFAVPAGFRVRQFAFFPHCRRTCFSKRPR